MKILPNRYTNLIAKTMILTKLEKMLKSMLIVNKKFY